MQFKRMLLMCSALITLAYSFPAEIQNITSKHQNDTTLSAKDSIKPLVLIMEEKDPKSNSVVVEFVYSSNGGNSVGKTTGSEKDKYVIENPVQEENKKQRSNGNIERKSAQIPSTQKKSQIFEKRTEESTVEISPSASLVPEEESPLLAKWPKYFYAFKPIKPFPELELQRSNQLTANKIIKENEETYIPNNGKERKDIPYVAGPQLSPLSIYDREFYVPIFD